MWRRWPIMRASTVSVLKLPGRCGRIASSVLFSTIALRLRSPSVIGLWSAGHRRLLMGSQDRQTLEVTRGKSTRILLLIRMRKLTDSV